MTIQTPEAEAPVMTRREAYDTMIQKACAFRELGTQITEQKNALNKLERELPNFHSVSSFDEVEAQEALYTELRPQVDEAKAKLNDMEVERQTLRVSICDILEQYNFDRWSYIFFQHNSELVTMHVAKFLSGESDMHISKQNTVEPGPRG